MQSNKLPKLLERMTKFADQMPGCEVQKSSSNKYGPQWVCLQISDEESLAALLKSSKETATKILVGGGAELPKDAAKGDYIFLDLFKLSKIIEHEPQDLVITVGTGMKLGDLRSYLVPHHQWFPASGHDDMTIADLINQGDAGLFEQGYGRVRDLILGMEVVTGDGITIKCGGKVVKNVTGYDTTKLFVGSRGSLVIPTKAHLRLSALPQASATIFFMAAEPNLLVELAGELLATGLPLACLELFDRRCVERDADNISAGALNLADSIAVQYALLVRVAGDPDLVKEIVPQLHSFTKKGSMQYLDVTSSRADDLVAALSHIPRGELLVQTSVTLSDFEKLLLPGGWWFSVERPQFQYRPGNGRLSIYARSSDEVEEMTKSLLLKGGLGCAAPHTVASVLSGSQYEVFESEKYPSIAGIKLSLKSHFDPEHILNPFAKL